MDSGYHLGPDFTDRQRLQTRELEVRHDCITSVEFYPYYVNTRYIKSPLTLVDSSISIFQKHSTMSSIVRCKVVVVVDILIEDKLKQLEDLIVITETTRR